MSKTTIIQQGESLPFNFDRGDNSISGWVCTIFVKEKPSDSALLTRVVAAEGNSWPGYLTEPETAALPVLTTGAPYYLIAKLTNSSTNEEELVTVRFKVSQAWA
jgi:hypothetical protein